MNTLIILTTANQLEFNVPAINSIIECNLENTDLVIVDDCSTDGTVEFCLSKGIKVLTKEKAKGLTDSWNVGYKYFKENNYDFLIYANNDILVPKGSIEQLVKSLKDNLIVSVMSTTKGVGHQQKQALNENYTLDIDDTNPDNVQEIQNLVCPDNQEPKLREVEYINGFFFGVNKDVLNYEFESNVLFNPKNISVGNENDLCDRVVDRKKYVCLTSFVFHFKGITFEMSNFENQDYDFNVNRNVIWSEAEKLKKNPIKRFLFRLKRKLK